MLVFDSTSSSHHLHISISIACSKDIKAASVVTVAAAEQSSSSSSSSIPNSSNNPGSVRQPATTTAATRITDTHQPPQPQLQLPVWPLGRPPKGTTTSTTGQRHQFSRFSSAARVAPREATKGHNDNSWANDIRSGIKISQLSSGIATTNNYDSNDEKRKSCQQS